MPTKTKAKKIAPNPLRDAMLAIETDLNGVLLEREEEIRSVLLALLAREHVFLLGPPGIAKSLLATEATARVHGAKLFEFLMSRFSTPEEVYGPPSLKALRERDRFERNGAGMLQEAQVAFLDEIWKANSAILNTLLPILNERLYREGGQVSKVPLQTMLCASNELPQGEDLGAIYDRVLLRHVVAPLSDPGLRSLMLNPPRVGQPKATISSADLATAQEQVRNVKMTEQTVDTLLKLRLELQKMKGVYVSDRRWRSILTVIKAQAFLAGRTETEDEDLLPLAHCLWSNPEHRSTVEIAVIGIAVPALREVREMLDVAHEMLRSFTTSGDENVRLETMQKLSALAKKSARKARKAGEAGKKIAAKIAAMHAEAYSTYQRALADQFDAGDLFDEEA